MNRAPALAALVLLVVLGAGCGEAPPETKSSPPVLVSSSVASSNWVEELCLERSAGTWSCSWLHLPRPPKFTAAYGDPDCARSPSGTTVCLVTTEEGKTGSSSGPSGPSEIAAAPIVPVLRPPKPDEDPALAKPWRFGNIAFNNPSPMTVGKKATVEVVLSTTLDAEDVRLMVTSPGSRHSAFIEVGRRMRATLDASKDDFEVVQIGQPIVAITDIRVARWKWEVRPKQSGSLVLHLTLSAVGKVDGSDADFAQQMYSHRIEVAVDWPRAAWNALTTNFQWLWVALIIPLLGWLYSRYQRWRKGTWKPPGSG